MDFEPEDLDFVSKGASKRESHALQALGKQLLALPKSKLERFDLPEAVVDALDEGRNLKTFEAKRRHLQLIGKLMRTFDTDAIQKTLDRVYMQSDAEADRADALEDWTQQILAEGDPAINAFLEAHPAGDRQKLRNLHRAAHREARQKNQPVKSAKLPTYLETLLP